MNTIRTLAAAAVVLASSLGAHAAPALEENGSAATSKSAKPAVARTMTAAATAKTQSTAKSQQVAYLCHYEYYYDVWGNYVYRYICF